MVQTEIPRQQWQAFCEQYTRQHHTWLVNLSVSDIHVCIGAETRTEEAEQRMRLLSESAVFQSIVAEPRYGSYAISVVIGKPPRQITHRIDDPAHLFFRSTEEGAHEGVVVESDSGQTTLLRFRTVALPEMLDGLTEAELEWYGAGIA